MRLAIATAAALAAGAVAAPLAPAADSFPCGGEETVTWWSGPVQPCPLTESERPDRWVPVYNEPVARAAGTDGPGPAGWLHGTDGQRFVCQQLHAAAQYHHPKGFRNNWWAFTKSDDGIYGWVPEVFFKGGLNDEPDSGLRRCPSGPTAEPTPQPGPPELGTPADSDGDGAPDGNDACPNENARPRDADLNGCLDYLHLKPDVKLTPGVYVRLVGNRYKPLGITVRRFTITGLPAGAQIVMSCSRSACPTQRVTAKSGRRVEFRRMRGRRLRAGVRVSLRATLDGAVGAGATYTVLRNDTRKREFCIRPGSTRKGSCSTRR